MKHLQPLTPEALYAQGVQRPAERGTGPVRTQLQDAGSLS